MATNRTHCATSWKAITPGTDLLDPQPTAVYADGAGNIVAVGADGNAETFVVSDGAVLPIQPTKITSATATGLKGLYNT